MIWGYHYFRKDPYDRVLFLHPEFTAKKSVSHRKVIGPFWLHGAVSTGGSDLESSRKVGGIPGGEFDHVF